MWAQRWSREELQAQSVPCQFSSSSSASQACVFVSAALTWIHVFVTLPLKVKGSGWWDLKCLCSSVNTSAIRLALCWPPWDDSPGAPREQKHGHISPFYSSLRSTEAEKYAVSTEHSTRTQITPSDFVEPNCHGSTKCFVLCFPRLSVCWEASLPFQSCGNDPLENTKELNWARKRTELFFKSTDNVNIKKTKKTTVTFLFVHFMAKLYEDWVSFVEKFFEVKYKWDQSTARNHTQMHTVHITLKQSKEKKRLSLEKKQTKTTADSFYEGLVQNIIQEHS